MAENATEMCWQPGQALPRPTVLEECTVQFISANDELFNNIVRCFLWCCLPYGTDFYETVLFHSGNFGAGKAWWKSLNFGFEIHYEPCIYLFIYYLCMTEGEWFGLELCSLVAASQSYITIDSKAVCVYVLISGCCSWGSQGVKLVLICWLISWWGDWCFQAITLTM